MIFILDNFDSFTYNIAQVLQKLGEEVIVRRAPDVSLTALKVLSPQKIILSPGPKRPRDHPFMVEVLTAFQDIPILGICLGMQAMNEWGGGSLQQDCFPVHGKVSSLCHEGGGLFRGVPSPFLAARYHSLVLDRLAEDFHVTSWIDHLPMSFQHNTLPLFGVQFHPESYLTPSGETILENFLAW